MLPRSHGRQGSCTGRGSSARASAPSRWRGALAAPAYYLNRVGTNDAASAGSFTAQLVEETSGGDTHRYSGSASLDAPLGSGELSVVAYAVRYDLDLFSNFTCFLVDPVHGDQFEQSDARWYFGGAAQWKAHGELAGLPAALRVGGEARQRLATVQTSLALWLLDLDSELLFTGDAGTTEPSRPSRRQGVEWSTRWEPLRWLLVDLDVALSRARSTAQPADGPDPGDRVPGSIESALSGGVTLHRLGPFSASVFVRYLGPRPLTEDDAHRSDGSTLVNAQASWRVVVPLLLTLDVFNVFDAQVDDIAYWYTSRLRGEPEAGVDDVHFHPAEKRSVRLTATVSF